MGFSITGDIGALGVIAIALAIGAGVIVVTWLLAAARQDRRTVLDEDAERTGGDG